MANIVVTGASRGIGLEFVKQLARYSQPTNVFALCRSPEKAEKLQDLANGQKNIKIIKADMTEFSNFSDIVKDVKHHIKDGGVNVLVNNAGIMLRDTLQTVTVENIQTTQAINAIAPLMFTKAMLPLLKQADGSKSLVKTGKSAVINISAQLGSIQENTTSGYISYRLSKAALNMVTKTLAVDLKPHDIFVLSLHPGWVKTDMGGKDAPITAESSVQAMLKSVQMAEEQHRGCLLGFKLRVIPW